MTKREFLEKLRESLKGLPLDDIEGKISYYGEMIDDRVEEGMSEEEAVASMESVESIVSSALSEVPLTKIVKEKITPKKTGDTRTTLLVILGFPLWFPLLAAAAAVAFSLYMVLWALVVSLWAVDVAFFAGTLAGAALSAVYFVHGNTAPGIAMIGAALFSAGLMIFLFLGCLGASKGVCRLTKKIILGIKERLLGRKNK